MLSRSIPRFLPRVGFVVGVVCAAVSAIPLRAVEDGGGYNTADPGANLPNWASGWPGTGLTGWNYVGRVNGASGTYLGSGWVLTAAHVGVGNFTLDGVTYPPVAGSDALVNGSVDLVLFQVAPSPSLPSLALGQLSPTPFSAQSAGDAVAMIGFGGGQGRTWGSNTVTGIHRQVSILQYTSIDFETAHGTTTIGSQSVTNLAQAVSGDSGGAGFIYNSSAGKWQLAGILEAAGQATFFVQLSAVVQPILDITGLATPPVIEVGPVGTSRVVGSSFTLFATVNGSKPLSYQWRKNGSSVPGATGATLTVANAQQSDTGNYSLTVTNIYGGATSSVATVTVSAPVPAMPLWAKLAFPLLLGATCHCHLKRKRPGRQSI